MSQMLFADFSDRNSAKRALEQLEVVGYRPDELRFISNNSDENERKLLSQSATVPSFFGSIVLGAALGGATGFLIAAILSQSSFMTSVGSLNRMTELLFVGLAGGSLLGATFNLVRRLFTPIDDIQHFENIIKNGGAIVVVPVNQADAPTVREILSDCQQGLLDYGWSENNAGSYLSASSSSAGRSKKDLPDNRILSTWL